MNSHTWHAALFRVSFVRSHTFFTVVVTEGILLTYLQAQRRSTQLKVTVVGPKQLGGGRWLGRLKIGVAHPVFRCKIC